MTNVTYFFDPMCVWTWRTTLWLRSVAVERDLDIEWRSCSLAILNEAAPPSKYTEPMNNARVALRLVESLRREGRHADSAAFYKAIGTRVHDNGEPFAAETYVDAARDAGLELDVAAFDDDSLDALVRESTDAAMQAAGPDVGSPVIQFDGVSKGFHGPIIGSVPNDKDGLVMFDSLITLLQVPNFYEIKRARR